jgi:hypothetical protein
MKKAGILSTLTTLSSIALVSAQTNFEVWSRTAAARVSEMFATLQLDPTGASTILLGILLFMIIYSIVKQMQLFAGMGALAEFFSLVAAVIISILTFVWLPEEFIENIVLQYGAMGATILAVIPFIIMLYFTAVVAKSLLIARVIWLTYGIYYFVLFIYQWGNAATTELDHVLYGAAVLLGIFVFLLIGPIRGWVWGEKLESGVEQAQRRLDERLELEKLREKEAEAEFGTK